MASILPDFICGLARQLSEYLVRSVQPDGRMVYLYHPSQQREDRTRDNSVRQWMATRALVAIKRQANAGDALSILRKNISYNLQTSYSEEGEL